MVNFFNSLACFLLTTDNTAIDCNNTAIEFFGFADKAEALSRYKEIFLPYAPGDAPFIVTHLADMESGDTIQVKLTQRNMKKEAIPCLVTLNCYKLNGEKFIVAQMLDRSPEIKNMVEAIERISRISREERDRYGKTQFLANMSHEIRTPLNTITGVTDIQLLKKNPLSADVRDAFIQIYKASESLLTIIDEILDLSKLESGNMEIKHQPYDLAKIISEAVHANDIHKGGKDLTFSLNVDKSLPATPVGDAVRIKQILSSLVSNAFKHTAVGSIVLSISLHRKKDNFCTFAIYIKDTGRGMTQAEIDAFNNSNYQDTWIGMNVTRELISLMNGTITLDSKVGEGSEFTVLIPQGISDDELIADSLDQLSSTDEPDSTYGELFSYEEMSYGKVLIVDDVESNLFVAKGLMEPYGLQLTTATSGEEALELVKDGYVYDVIFMDHMMPGMDGIQTANAIFATGYNKPIIALTANALLGNEELFLESGFAAFISKPINMAELDKHLLQFVKRHTKEAQQDIVKLTLPPNIPLALLSIVVRDVDRILSVLEPLMEKPDWNDADYKLYTINTPGMKSAMANIGQHHLSEEAKMLESAGMAKNMGLIQQSTPAFIAQLKTIKNLVPPEQENSLDRKGTGQILRHHLETLKMACKTYNKMDARAAVEMLQGYSWCDAVTHLVTELSNH